MDTAGNHFLNGYFCSEAVVKYFTDDKTLLKASTGFGAGIAYGNSLCGALTGGIIALSSIQGRGSKEEDQTILFENINKLNNSFKNEFGSYECPKLLGFNLTDENASQRFEKENCKTQKCAVYVDFVAKKTKELLATK